MSYEVRLAEYGDLKWLLDYAAKRMLTEDVGNPDMYQRGALDNLVLKAMHSETLFVATYAGEPVGVLGGIAVPHYLNPDKNTLAEIMWYVLPEHRQSRGGLLLLRTYAKKAKEFDYATFSLLAGSPISDRTLSKYGFHLKERSFLMEN